MAEAAPPLADGRYRLVSELGAGGMATVYRAYDSRLQVMRAIKILAPELASRKALRARFEAEASTMALLEHRNIVRVYDVGKDDDRIFIVMELVDGGSLLDRVKEGGPIPPRMAVAATVDMLEALQLAHDRGVVHRDIKPHNILLSDEGVVRVTDFGIARMRRWEEDDDGLTKTGSVMGTWGFMAPEQRVDAKSVDHRADLYSVGATLFSVLTDKTPVDLFVAARKPELLTGIPEALAQIILRSTCYEREDRYDSATDMAVELRGCLQLLPEDPAEAPPLYKQRVELEPIAYDRVGGGTGLLAPGTLVPSEEDLAELEAETDEQPPLLEPEPFTSPLEPLPEGPLPDSTGLTEPLPALEELAPPPPPSAPEPRRGSALRWETGVAVLALLIAGGLAWREFNRPEPAPTPPVAQQDPQVQGQPPEKLPAEVDPKGSTEGPDPEGTALPAEAPPVPVDAGKTDPPPKDPVVSAGRTDPPPKDPVVAVVDPPPKDPVSAGPALIEHRVPASASVGSTLELRFDLPSPDYSVTVFHRPAGGAYVQAKAVASGSTFTARIPIDERYAGKSVEYHVKASPRGDAPSVDALGSGFKPEVVPVR